MTLSLGLGMMVALPGFHPAGQTSPCLSTYWKAWTSRRVSSTSLQEKNRVEHDFDILPANREIVDSDLSNDLVRIDDEKASESDSLILKKNAIVARDRFGQVRDKRDVHFSETTFFSWSLGPGKMGEVRVYRSGNDFGADCSEFFNSIARIEGKFKGSGEELPEGDDLSGTNEREIKRVEEEDKVLALVVRERDLLEITVNDSFGSKRWSGLANGGLKYYEPLYFQFCAEIKL